MVVKQKKRSEIPECYKWRLTDIFATDDAWREAHAQVLAELKGLAAYQGRLTTPQALADCLALNNRLRLKAAHVAGYAHMRHHEDMAEPVYLGMKMQAVRLSVELEAASAFIEPEILAADEDTVNELMRAEPVYGHYLRDLLRSKAHVRSAEVEEVLAGAGEMASAAYDAFSMLENADMRFGVVTDGAGNEVELTQGRFISLMESRNREVRANVFRKYYSVFEAHRNTLAAMYAGSVKGDLFYSRMRGYPTALEASLFEFNIPRAVCDSLIAEVNAGLPQLHRYMELRRKRLGVDELHMYDLYTPIVPDADTRISYAEAKATVLKALAPLGEEYTGLCARGLEDGWIDVYENENKHGGAYSWDDVYGVHPYVLLNFDDKLDDMFTLAHELGHALHTCYTDAAQPYIYSGYSIFVAEIASTVNEALLTEHLLKNVTEAHKRAYIINHYLEQFRTTLFRQTMFAEFEMQTHELAERGESLTAEVLCRVYRELNTRYYGAGVTVDGEIDMEWARIPHFYNAFYVYQYATGMSAALALARAILDEGAPAVERYLGFLRSGASGYPLDILKAAGVDMTANGPVKSAMEVFTRLVGEMEAALE